MHYIKKLQYLPRKYVSGETRRPVSRKGSLHPTAAAAKFRADDRELQALQVVTLKYIRTTAKPLVDYSLKYSREQSSTRKLISSLGKNQKQQNS